MQCQCGLWLVSCSPQRKRLTSKQGLLDVLKTSDLKVSSRVLFQSPQYSFVVSGVSSRFFSKLT